MKFEVIDRDTAWVNINAMLSFQVYHGGKVNAQEKITRAELEDCLREMDEAGKIEVGDFVEVVATDNMSVYQRDRVGQFGKVTQVSAAAYGVEFAKYSRLSNNLNGNTKQGHGVWFIACMLRKAE